jgi:hypothetical protein
VLAVVFPVFFVALWLVILNFIGKVTGWASLAEHYRLTDPFLGETWPFQSAQMRYMSHYNGCLTFGANEQGMYVAGWGPFRIGAAPLLVPWGELTLEPKKRWLISGYELHFRQSPDVYMWVRSSLGEKLLRASSQPMAGIRMAPPIG